MRQMNTLNALLGLLLCALLPVSQRAMSQQASTNDTRAKPAPTSKFLQSSVLDLSLLVPHHPIDNSSITKDELRQLHAIEAKRNPKQAEAAKADDAEQDIFIFREIFGSSFAPENLPLLAALSADLHEEEGIATSPLKKEFARQRPYQLDRTLHPICKTTTEPNSYPSGHALAGYLLGYTLAYIAPGPDSGARS